MEFDHIFWFPSIVWKNFKNTECAHRLHQNKTTERRQIQLVLSYQKYWSNSIFHFIFLQKVSFNKIIVFGTPKLILRQTYKTEKFSNFHTVFYFSFPTLHLVWNRATVWVGMLCDLFKFCGNLWFVLEFIEGLLKGLEFHI